jgi:hypothetical protein
MRTASGRPLGARATRRALLAITSTALAAGLLAATASTATASVTGPVARTATGVTQPAFGCKPNESRPPYCYPS